MSFSVHVGLGGKSSDHEAAILRRKRMGDMVSCERWERKGENKYLIILRER
jgi:hypothetical protein